MNSGNPKINSLNFETKLLLFMRAVYSTVNWKFSRWPYQKSVADELDAMQSHMVSILLRIPRSGSEDWVMWARRSRRLARSLIVRIGSWSEAWAQRTISLHEHVTSVE